MRFFFDRLISAWKDAAFTLNIKKFFFEAVEASHWSTLKAERIEKFDDRDHFECEALTDIEKTEMRASNWFEKTMTSFCISSSISFLFIQSFSNMTSWWFISAINIETVNFLWLSTVRLSRILWIMIFFVSFPSYSLINFSLASRMSWISSFWHIWSTSFVWIKM